VWDPALCGLDVMRSHQVHFDDGQQRGILRSLIHLQTVPAFQTMMKAAHDRAALIIQALYSCQVRNEKLDEVDAVTCSEDIQRAEGTGVYKRQESYVCCDASSDLY
jgi:hypothetical protein